MVHCGVIPSFADHRTHVLGAIAAVRRACDPFELVRAANPPDVNWGVLSIGKAAPAMDAACPSALGRRLVITTQGTELWGAPELAEIVDHPLPSYRNVRATERALRWLQVPKLMAAGDDRVLALDRTDPAKAYAMLAARDRERVPLLVLLSGGASACLASPMPGLALADLKDVTRLLLRAGCGIDDLNIVRKHLELLKGGRLAAHLAPVPIMAYILSDVVSGDIASVGSGPLSPDASTFDDAISIMRAYGVSSECPGVMAFLERGRKGQEPETLKPGDAVFSSVETRVVGTWRNAVNAAAANLQEQGFEVAAMAQAFEGEARECARRCVSTARAFGAMKSPSAFVMGGESTVHVGEARGAGGRNQEFALNAALGLHGTERIALAAFASDGVDGPTDAAGAIVRSDTVRHAESRGVDLEGSLREHDSHTALGALDCLIRTGPTGTNVNDLVIVLKYPA